MLEKKFGAANLFSFNSAAAGRKLRRYRNEREETVMNARMMAAGIAGVVAACAVASAEEESRVPGWLVPTASVGVDFASQQQTRGLVDNEDPIVTGSASVGVGPASL